MYIKLNAKIYVNGKLQKNELEKIVKMILQGGLNIAHCEIWQEWVFLSRISLNTNHDPVQMQDKLHDDLSLGRQVLSLDEVYCLHFSWNKKRVIM